MMNSSGVTSDYVCFTLAQVEMKGFVTLWWESFKFSGINIKEKKIAISNGASINIALKCDLEKNYVAIKKKISQQGM